MPKRNNAVHCTVCNVEALTQSSIKNVKVKLTEVKLRIRTHPKLKKTIYTSRVSIKIDT